MGNFTLQTGPCSFLYLHIGPWEITFPLLLCFFSLAPYLLPCRLLLSLLSRAGRRRAERARAAGQAARAGGRPHAGRCAARRRRALERAARAAGRGRSGGSRRAGDADWRAQAGAEPGRRAGGVRPRRKGDGAGWPRQRVWGPAGGSASERRRSALAQAMAVRGAGGPVSGARCGVGAGLRWASLGGGRGRQAREWLRLVRLGRAQRAGAA
jgi:hypothetical protein